ncbi:MAG: LPP20 family lipoprotein [Spirochaetota bacterium]
MTKSYIEGDESMRIIKLLLLPVIGAAVLFACASAPEQPAKELEQPDFPEWYLNPPIAEDAIYGLGMAKLSSDDMSRKMAASRARDDIAFQINVTVKSAITDYAQEAGVDAQKQVINFAESVSRQIANTKLAGAKTVKQYKGKDNTWYVLVMYPMNNLKEDVQQEFVRNEGSMFAEFKANEALKRLEAEVDSNPPKAGQSPASKEK